MSFTNVYYKRTTATDKSCYVCYKPTNTVLATINAVDFLYTCDGHLLDSGFAALIQVPDDKPSVSQEAIDKIKLEWEEKEKRRKEKEKEKEKEKDDKKEKEKPQDNDKVVEKVAATPSGPRHLKYALHRDYFAMRLAEHKKRKQTAAAKALSSRLPVSLNGSLEDKF